MELDGPGWIDGPMATYGKIAIVAVVVIEAALLISAWMLGTSNADRGWCLLANVAGVVLGWTIGTVCSPLNDSERADFSKYASVFAGFVSGFAVSKIDRVFEEAARAGVIATAAFLAPIVVFGISTLLFGMLLILWRRYNFQ